MSPLHKRPKPSSPDNDMIPTKHVAYTHIDGSMLEGGGQLLRNASALSAITAAPLHIDNIRAKRSKPGLRPQHLTGLQLMETLSTGTLQGGQVNSTEIHFTPGPLCCRDATGDTKTAGSCMLLAQSAVPCLLLAAAPPSCEDHKVTTSHIVLKGGTDATLAPPVGYMQHVLLPMLRRHLGIDITLDLQRRGFFPKGGGLVDLKVAALAPGSCINPITLTDPGHLLSITISAFTAGKLPESIAHRMTATAKTDIEACLKRLGLVESVTVSSEAVHEPKDRAVGDGCGILLVAETSTGCILGGTCLGERGLTAETVGSRAAAELIQALEIGACTDEWLQDQLVIFMALAQGKSAVLTGEPTLHTRTAIAVAEKLTTAKFNISEVKEKGLWLIECEGAGIPAGGLRQA